jgi:hypothetical protein
VSVLHRQGRTMSVSKEDRLHILLSELLSTGGALSVPVLEVLVDALLAEQVEAFGDRHLLEAILAHRAAQHAQSHLQHGRLV